MVDLALQLLALLDRVDVVRLEQVLDVAVRRLEGDVGGLPRPFAARQVLRLAVEPLEDCLLYTSPSPRDS